jgi:uncharacterized membrane protein YhaH (DUF805 family)
MNFLFGFSGRFTRLDWWVAVSLALTLVAAGSFAVMQWFQLGPLAAAALSGSIKPEAAMQALPQEALIAFAPLAMAATLIIAAATVKRCHDRTVSGWWALFALVPGIGQMWLFSVNGVFVGDQFENRFGDGGSCEFRSAPAATGRQGAARAQGGAKMQAVADGPSSKRIALAVSPSQMSVRQQAQVAARGPQARNAHR